MQPTTFIMKIAAHFLNALFELTLICCYFSRLSSKPKQILFTKVNICEPRQNGERSRCFFYNFWNYAKVVKMANSKCCKETLSKLKVNKCLYDGMLCSLYKMVSFLVIYISVTVTAFKINSFIFLCFTET